MKEPQWDDSMDDSKEFFDATVILPDDESDDADDDEPVKAASSKNHITELRRRIEERLDSKRIDHEFDYEDLDTSDLDGLYDSMG
tara:strand:- start:1443 stop:1697 length:255 start_codon:yes stop_codon:yes gene_type:complete